MHFAHQELSKKLKQNNINSLNKLYQAKNNKFKQTLKFMTEWSNDLLQRQHQLYKNQQNLNQQLLELQSKSKSVRTQRTKQTSRPTASSLNIQQIIQEQLISKIQQVYTKQIMLYQSTQPLQNNTFNSQKSYNHLESCQQSQKSQSQHHHRLSSNFSNYFNDYECNTEVKANHNFSKESETGSKASELVQQQYYSNSINEVQNQDQEHNYCEEQHDGYDTYQENFVQF